VTAAVVELADISKQYGGLRPLRIASLVVGADDRLAIVGVDLAAAETLVNLVTGASLPDAGEVRAFGRSTAAIADSTEWLALVDRFGIVTERAVLLDALSVVQNLAMPFSLDIEPPGEEVRERAVALAAEVGLAPDVWDRPVGELDGALRLRVRIGRALALDPAVMLLEHPTAVVERGAVGALGRDVRGIAERRRIALLTLTADEEFAALAGARVLQLDAASGRLAERRRRNRFSWLRG
jgi:ABC-type transporter Mla maintaining outer membrane lipid asymmetry ATPase subunit MlaF